MKLRDYQEELVSSALNAWADGVRRPLIVAATGAGKTIVSAEIMRRIPTRCLFLADAKELVKQNADKYLAHTGERAGVEMAESTAGDARVVIASTQSIARRLGRFSRDAFTHIICDEAHRNSLGNQAGAVFDYFSSAKVLGLTATPWRADGRPLVKGDGADGFYDKVVCEVGLRRLIEAGHLARVTVKSIPLSVSLRGVRTLAGDYNERDLADTIRPHIRAACEQLKAHAQGRKTVVYLPLCELSREFVAIATEAGLRAVHVDGTDREGIARFAAGEYDIISNAALLTTGWDCPQVDCILPLRPTKSLALYCQIIGRGTRNHPGKRDLLLLDPLYLADKHDVCSPADMVMPRGATAAQKRTEEGRETDLFEVEAIVEGRVRAEREAAIRREAKEAQRRQEVQRDLLERKAEAEVARRESWTGPPTPAQVWLLRQHGRTARTKGEAARLIAVLKNRTPQQPAAPGKKPTVLTF